MKAVLTDLIGHEILEQLTDQLDTYQHGVVLALGGSRFFVIRHNPDCCDDGTYYDGEVGDWHDITCRPITAASILAEDDYCIVLQTADGSIELRFGSNRFAYEIIDTTPRSQEF